MPYAAPEASELEAKPDAALALLDLYEQMLHNFRRCNLDGYCRDGQKAMNDPSFLLSEEDREIVAMYHRRTTLEALLSLDIYGSQLSEKETERMMEDFDLFADIEYQSAARVFGDAEKRIEYDCFVMQNQLFP